MNELEKIYAKLAPSPLEEVYDRLVAATWSDEAREAAAVARKSGAHNSSIDAWKATEQAAKDGSAKAHENAARLHDAASQAHVPYGRKGGKSEAIAAIHGEMARQHGSHAFEQRKPEEAKKHAAAFSHQAKFDASKYTSEAIAKIIAEHKKNI